MTHADFLIVGGGIVGLTVARALAKRKLGSVAVLEKEPALGLHSSGRNSGVIHSGIYYSPGSLKARVCAEGARLMREYAHERGIRCVTTGKVVVAWDEVSSAQIDELKKRADANGAAARIVNERELKDIEPEAVTRGRALHVPGTAVIDSKAVLASLERELSEAGVRVERSSGVTGVDAKRRVAKTSQGERGYGVLVNAAGLHADKIAHAMEAGRRYRILPFKGIYRKLSAAAAKRYRGSVYPVPDLRVPFLGVHITKTVDGDVTVGPTAIPALGRENYGRLDGIDVKELAPIAGSLVRLAARNADGFRTLVREELGRYTDAGFLTAVRRLSPSLQGAELLPSDKVGIRAQLLDTEKMRLEMDWIVESGPASVHVLNAVSPAFTGSLAFAEIVADRAEAAR